MRKNKLYIIIAILAAIFLFTTAAICNQYQAQPEGEITEEEEAAAEEVGEGTIEEELVEEAEEDEAEEENTKEEAIEEELEEEEEVTEKEISDQKIAFTSDRDGISEIYVMNADGSGQTNLTNNPDNDGSHPEYLIIIGSDGWQVIVSVPHFSEHTIIISSVVEAISSTTAIVLYIAIVAILGIMYIVPFFLVRKSK